MCVTSSAVNSVGKFMRKPEVGISALFVSIVTICTLFMSKDLRFSVPSNYILLLLATIAEAVSVSAMTAEFDVTEVLSTICVLALTLVCLFSGSFFVKDSPSLQSGLIISTGIAGFLALFLLPFLLMHTYGKGYEWAWVAFAVLGCFMSGAYVIVDLLIIMDIALAQ